MNNKFWLALFIIFTFAACGGGGGSNSYSGSSGGSSGSSSSSTPTNLNPTNDCKKAWYTSMPTASSTNPTFNNYSFFSFRFIRIKIFK